MVQENWAETAPATFAYFSYRMPANHSFLDVGFHIFSTAMSNRDRISPHFLHNEADKGACGAGQVQLASVKRAVEPRTANLILVSSANCTFSFQTQAREDLPAPGDDDLNTTNSGLP